MPLSAAQLQLLTDLAAAAKSQADALVADDAPPPAPPPAPAPAPRPPSAAWTEITPDAGTLTDETGSVWSGSRTPIANGFPSGGGWPGVLMTCNWPKLYLQTADGKWWDCNRNTGVLTEIADPRPVAPPPPAPTPPAPPPPPPPASAPAPVTAAAGVYRYNRHNLFQNIAQTNRPSTIGGFTYNANIYAPTYNYVDFSTGWKWANPGGDWIDSLGVAQGTSAFTTLAANSASGETAVFSYTGIVVTSLVSDCFTHSKPCAFVLRNTGGPRQVGSLYSTLGPVPQINVTYQDGTTAILACRVLACSTSSSATPVNTGDRLSFPIFIEFDRPTKKILSATTNLTVTAHWSGTANIQYMRCNPPLNAEVVTGSAGLAASAGALDSGITAVPGILGAQRYVDGTLRSDFVVPGTANFNAESNYDPALWGGASNTAKWPHTVAGKWINPDDPNATVPPALVSSGYTGEGFEPLYPGLGALKVKIPDSNLPTGADCGYFGTLGSNMKMFLPFDQMGLLDRIFIRYYYRIGAPTSLTPADRTEYLQDTNKVWADMAGKTGIGPAHWYAIGGGYPNSGGSGGSYGWQMRDAWAACDEASGPGSGGAACGYHLYDFGSNNPVGYRYIGEPQQPSAWGQKGGLGAVFYPGKWYLIEKEIKLNSVDLPSTAGDGKNWTANGELRTWIDGRLAFERTGLVFRTLPKVVPAYNADQLRPHRDLGISELWLNDFHGGVTQSSADWVRFYTGLAYGTSRIGPMKAPAPAWAASVPADTWTTLANTNYSTWALASMPGPQSSYLGTSPYNAIVNAFCDAAFDGVSKQFFYGGGHGDGTCNAVVEFDANTLQYRLAGLPTPPAKYPPSYATGGTSLQPGPLVYPSGYQSNDVWNGTGYSGGYFHNAPPLFDPADTPYATPTARGSSHMYAAAAMRGKVIHYFYLTYGEFNTQTGEWNPDAVGIDLGKQLLDFRTQYNPYPLQQGTVAVYDDVTDRFYITLNPGDNGGGWRSGIIVFNPNIRRIEAIYESNNTSPGIDYGLILNSINICKVGRDLYCFLKPNETAPVSMNSGFIFNMDTRAFKKFVITGDPVGTKFSDQTLQATIPSWYDGTSIHRWNYEAANRGNVHTVNLTPTSGTGTPADPYMLTQTARAVAAPPTGTTFVFKRIVYVPAAGCAVLIPKADQNYVALKLS